MIPLDSRWRSPLPAVIVESNAASGQRLMPRAGLRASAIKRLSASPNAIRPPDGLSSRTARSPATAAVWVCYRCRCRVRVPLGRGCYQDEQPPGGLRCIPTSTAAHLSRPRCQVPSLLCRAWSPPGAAELKLEELGRPGTTSHRPPLFLASPAIWHWLGWAPQNSGVFAWSPRL